MKQTHPSELVDALAKRQRTKLLNVPISPELARFLLATQIKNRRVRPMRVTQITRDIAADRWNDALDYLRFGFRGDLVDGQHRLLACIRASKTIVVDAQLGLTDDEAALIDTNRSRTPGDTLAIAGVPSASKMGTAANVVLSMLQQPNYPYSVGNNSTSRAELLRFVRDHQDDLHQAVMLHDRIRHTLKCAQVASGVLFFMRLDAEEKAMQFASIVATGDASLDCPARVLRETLFRNTQASRKVPPAVYWAWWIKAANAFITGRKMKALRHRLDEAFPTMVFESYWTMMGDYCAQKGNTNAAD